MAGWSRRQGWAILRLPGHGLTVLAQGRPGGVGETVFVLQPREDDSRSIGQSAIVGEGADSSLRLADPVAIGSPVLNAAGELVGVVVEADEPSLGEAGMVLNRPGMPVGTRMVPVDALVPGPGSAGTTLAALAAQGHFMRPLSAERRHVVSGVFAARVQRGGVVPMPADQRTSFARGEGQVFVFVQWSPEEKTQSMSAYEIYDADNKLIGRSEQVPLKLKKDQPLFSSWSFPISRLPAGAYRVDLLMGPDPVWRGWVRITD